MRTFLAASIVWAGTVLGAAPAAAETNFTIAGASPGGLWSLLGAGVERAVTSADPDATVTYQTSAGGFANVALVTRGDVQLGIVHNAELKLAVTGAPPFTESYPDLRAIAVLYDFALFHPLVTEAFAERYGVRSFADIREKGPPLRIVINREGNIARELALEMLKAHGISADDIRSWGGVVHTAGSSEAAKLVTGRRADMITNTVFINHSVIREIEAAMPVHLLAAEEPALEEVSSRLDLDIRTIPAGAYEWLEDDVRTVSLSAVLVADAGLDEDRAYMLTRAMIEHLDRIRSVHKSLEAMDLEMMGSLRTVPYHPGAARAFEEAGLEVPTP